MLVGEGKTDRLSGLKMEFRSELFERCAIRASVIE